MKIGINALYLLPGKVGGSETYIRNLVKWLAKIDGQNEYIIFINRESVFVFDPLPSRFRVITCPFHAENRFVRILWEQFALPFQIRRHRIDVLLSAGMTAPFFCLSASVLMLFDLQHINQPRNFSLFMLFFLRTIIYASAKSADGILTISGAARRDIMRYYHIQPENIAVTHLAVDHEMFRSVVPGNRPAILTKYGIPEPYILYAASSLPHKNHLRLFQAFEKVRKYAPGLKLVLIGARDKGEQTIVDMIAVSGLTNDVILLGWLPFEDVPAIYGAARAFVFPTLHEGFGLPVIEAMACGVPVACSNIEPLTEIANGAALFVNPLDPDDIARGIVTVVTDEQQREQLREKGLKRAQQFSWKITAEETLSFLAHVYSRKGRPS